MTDLGTYEVVFVDGPTASGKSTYIATLHAASKFSTVSYKAFGFANLFATALLRIFPSRSRRKVFDEVRDDPIMRLDEIMLRRFSIFCGCSELLYKTFQMIKVAVVSSFAGTIVDEGVTLRYANYLNVMRGGGISKRAFEILVTMDLTFLGLLSRRRKVLYLYMDVDGVTLESRWRARGHTTQYNHHFERMVQLGWSYYRPLMSTMPLDTLIVSGNGLPPGSSNSPARTG